MKKKVALHNLGCKVNAYEVEAMQQLLENAGYETVPFEEGADVYVTGDIDHHTGIDTVAEGLTIIDAGHYGTEYIFMEAMKEKLNKAFNDLKITCAKVKSPYTIL